jgi:LPXTG-motif cell wall-anchored protein
MLIAVLVLGYGARSAWAETSSQVYVPLIGISSVPDPLALPGGPGNVTYHYAVKNFLQEYPLTNVHVTDDKCSPVTFAEGDDNGDGKLDYTETWRYTCTIKLSETTQSIATAIGTANNLPAAHKAYATVIVGSDNSPPLVNIINITKVAYPLTLPAEGGDITFTYRVNNPGVVPLSNVTVTDDKCSAMSGKLGDTNGNNLLDITEVWVYTCTTHLTQTTTNTVSVAASANGLMAVGYATITVTVAQSPGLPNTGTRPNIKVIIWGTLSALLAALIVFFSLIQKKKLSNRQ